MNERASFPSVAVHDLVRRGREIGEAVKAVGATGARFVLTRYGVPVAAVVSLRDLDVLAAADRAAGYDLDSIRKNAGGADVRTESPDTTASNAGAQESRP